MRARVGGWDRQDVTRYGRQSYEEINCKVARRCVQKCRRNGQYPSSLRVRRGKGSERRRELVYREPVATGLVVKDPRLQSPGRAMRSLFFSFPGCQHTPISVGNARTRYSSKRLGKLQRLSQLGNPRPVDLPAFGLLLDGGDKHRWASSLYFGLDEPNGKQVVVSHAEDHQLHGNPHGRMHRPPSHGRWPISLCRWWHSDGCIRQHGFVAAFVGKQPPPGHLHAAGQWYMERARRRGGCQHATAGATRSTPAISSQGP